jgi:hypothetical protein
MSQMVQPYAQSAGLDDPQLRLVNVPFSRECHAHALSSLTFGD